MRFIVPLLVLLALIGGCSKEEKLAGIDGHAVTEAEFEAYLQFKRHRADDEKKRARLLEQYLERLTLATAIGKTDVLDKALIDAELEEFRKEMLISRYFEKYLKDKVDEASVRNYYNTHASEYEQQQVRVAHLLIRTNPKMSETERKAKLTAAQEAYSKIRSGALFAEIAEQYSEDKVSAKKGGDLGWIKKGGIDKRFSQVAFDQEAGGLSEPFETVFGYHVLTVLEAPRTVKPSFESLAGDIRYQLRNKAKQAEVKRLLKSVKAE